MADITVMNKQEQEINTGATQENTATQPLPVEPVTPVPSYVEGLTEDEADQEAVTTEEPKFLSLEEILGMDTADLTAEKQGFFHSEKLGDIPYTAISYDDYKQAKKDCVTYDQDENGVIQTKVDDDKLMTKIVILAVDKDQRSNFTFANGALTWKSSSLQLKGCNTRPGKGLCILAVKQKIKVRNGRTLVASANGATR